MTLKLGRKISSLHTHVPLLVALALLLLVVHVPAAVPLVVRRLAVPLVAVRVYL